MGMLVLTINEGGTLLIGTGPEMVAVTVLEQRTGGRVRLGIVAPHEVPVDRLEVRRAKEASAEVQMARKGR